jgi:hypothetical protein
MYGASPASILFFNSGLCPLIFSLAQGATIAVQIGGTNPRICPTRSPAYQSAHQRKLVARIIFWPKFVGQKVD